MLILSSKKINEFKSLLLYEVNKDDSSFSFLGRSRGKESEEKEREPDNMQVIHKNI